MALRSLGRLIPRNLDPALSVIQTRSTLRRLDSHNVPTLSQNDFKIPTRLFTSSIPSLNVENTVEKASPDFSVLDPASEAAASLIRNQVEELTKSLPLTERLFAVVQIDGQQYRVSHDDVLTVEDWLTASAGERIRLEKVLLVGGREFSLIGRPLLRRSQVCVEATVIEKSLTAQDIIRRFRQRSRFKKTWLTRKPITYLRINSIKLLSPQ